MLLCLRFDMKHTFENETTEFFTMRKHVLMRKIVRIMNYSIVCGWLELLLQNWFGMVFRICFGNVLLSASSTSEYYTVEMLSCKVCFLLYCRREQLQLAYTFDLCCFIWTSCLLSILLDCKMWMYNNQVSLSILKNYWYAFYLYIQC